MARRLLLAALIAGFLVTVTASADPIPVSCGVDPISPCLSIWPPAPVNLQQTGATEDTISLSWDEPASAFTVVSATQTEVTIGWLPPPDPTVDHYTVERPDGAIWGTTALTEFAHRVARKTSQFRACVYATNALGQTGPRLCGTFTKNG